MRAVCTSQDLLARVSGSIPFFAGFCVTDVDAFLRVISAAQYYSKCVDYK
jgi:hypothetical protein